MILGLGAGDPQDPTGRGIRQGFDPDPTIAIATESKLLMITRGPLDEDTRDLGSLERSGRPQRHT